MSLLIQKLDELKQAYQANNITHCANILLEIVAQSEDGSVKDGFFGSEIFQKIFLDAYTKNSTDMLSLFTLALNPAKPYSAELFRLVKTTPSYDGINYLSEPSEAFLEQCNAGFLAALMADTNNLNLSQRLEQRILIGLQHNEQLYTRILFALFTKNNCMFSMENVKILQKNMNLLVRNPAGWPLIGSLLSLEDEPCYLVHTLAEDAIDHQDKDGLEFILSLGFGLPEEVTLRRVLLNKCINSSFEEGISLLCPHFEDDLNGVLMDNGDVNEDDASFRIAFKVASKRCIVALVDAVMESECNGELITKMLHYAFSDEASQNDQNDYLARGAILHALCLNWNMHSKKLMQLMGQLPAEKVQRSLTAVPVQQNGQWTEFNFFPLRQFLVSPNDLGINPSEKLKVLLNHYQITMPPIVAQWHTLISSYAFSSLTINYFNELMQALSSVAMNNQGFNPVDVNQVELQQILPKSIRELFSEIDLTLYLQAIPYFLNNSGSPELPPELRLIECIVFVQNARAESLAQAAQLNAANRFTVFPAPKANGQTQNNHLATGLTMAENSCF